MAKPRQPTKPACRHCGVPLTDANASSSSWASATSTKPKSPKLCKPCVAAYRRRFRANIAKNFVALPKSLLFSLLEGANVPYDHISHQLRKPCE